MRIRRILYILTWFWPTLHVCLLTAPSLTRCIVHVVGKEVPTAQPSATRCPQNSQKHLTYTHMYIYTYAHTYTCLHTHTHTHTHTHCCEHTGTSPPPSTGCTPAACFPHTGTSSRCTADGKDPLQGALTTSPCSQVGVCVDVTFVSCRSTP